MLPSPLKPLRSDWACSQRFPCSIQSGGEAVLRSQWGVGTQGSGGGAQLSQGSLSDPGRVPLSPHTPDLAQLRKKFEEDKQRIELMRAQRKFRPY